MATQGSIFISYRRGDSAHAAGRLYDRLSRHFGSDRLFMDIDTIDLGHDFVNEIQSAVSECQVMLALIGPSWLTATDEDGLERLQDPHDFVRLEIVSALEQGVDIIPLLLDGTSMPQAEDLPAVLEPLSTRNGLEVGHARFNDDVDRLIDGIEAIFAKRAAMDPAMQDKATEKTRQLVSLGITLAWFLSGVIFWFANRYMFERDPDMAIPLVASGLAAIVGALLVGILIKRLLPQAPTDILAIGLVGWAVGVGIGWATSFAWGDIQIESGIPLGAALGGLIIGTATGFILRNLYSEQGWVQVAVLAVGWALAWAVGMVIHHQLFYDYGTSFSIWFFPFLLTTALLAGLLFWQYGRLDRS